MLEAIDALAGQHRAARQGQHGLAPRRCGSSCAAGAAGFKLHEDWGTTPAAIDACLTVAQAAGRAGRHPHRHAERGRVTWRRRCAAIGGRPIHAYHTEGAGGGHAPDIITVASHAERAAVVDQPDPPAHASTPLDEHLDMLMVCHHLNPSMPEDLAFAESRIRPVDHRGRGRPARPGRDLDDRLGLPGHGPDRRDRSSAPGRPRT